MLTIPVKERLASLYSLTPGDFKTVAQQLNFSAEAWSPLTITEALKRETDYKQEEYTERSGSALLQRDELREG